MDVQTKRNIYDSVMQEVNTLAKELLTEQFTDDKDDIFEEVVCNYFDEDKGMWSVDAWEPIENEEEDENQGRVIAYIDPESLSVTWIDADAVDSPLANKVIDEKIEELENSL